MSLLNSVFGTTGITGGHTMATNNAAQNAVTNANAYNQAMMAANIVPGPLVAKQVDIRRSPETRFTVLRAHNGYVVTSTDTDTYDEIRYIAATVEEVKDLVASILVQNKLSEP